MYNVYKEDPSRFKDWTFQTFIDSTGKGVHLNSRRSNVSIADIFRPLFEVSINPSKHPDLHHFLKQVTPLRSTSFRTALRLILLPQVVGLDCVDDESKPEKRLPRYPPPKDWTTAHNPPYSYYLYYLCAPHIGRLFALAWH